MAGRTAAVPAFRSRVLREPVGRPWRRPPRSRGRGPGKSAHRPAEGRIIPAGSSLTVAVIPARFASTRFPGKILHPLHGSTILAHLLERALGLRGLDRVLVATDDERIADEARRCGAEAVMTSPLHASGSDRIGEVVATLRPVPGFILNLQGDEPLFSPPAIERLLRSMRERPDAIWTLAEPIRDAEEFARSSVVKVVTDAEGRALYFSRAPIPHFREGGEWAGFPPRRHVGVYGYPRALLQAFLAQPPSRLERIEGLEQLRALEAGLTIRVLTGAWTDAGIDTPEDLERLRAKYPDAASIRRAGLEDRG